MTFIRSQKFKKIFLAAFITAIGVLFLWTSSTRPSVLIIHAQNAKSPWVQTINKGIRSIFKSRTFYHVYYHYMDIKELPNGTSEINTTKKTLDIIQSLKPDYLILVDDLTQEKIGKHYVGKKDINVIYCGIKRPLKAYNYHTAKNVTGISLSLPLEILNELFEFNINEDVFKDDIQLTVMGDLSTASQEDSRTFKNYKKWEQVRLKKPINVQTFQDWKKHIKGIRGPNDVILLSNYHSLTYSKNRTKFVPPQEIIQWTLNNAHVPIIGLYGFFALDGGSLSIAPSAFELGEKAAKIVENLIENDVYITEIPPKESKHFLIYLRKNKGGKAEKIKIPALYETFARSTHHYYN